MLPNDAIFALVLPEHIVNHHFRILMKRRKQPNMPQVLYDKFDGDEHRTKFWIEEKDGDFELWSYYEGKPFNQKVMTTKEMVELQKNEPHQALSSKAKLMNLFVELGCSPDDALENATTFVQNFTEENGRPMSKMLVAFVLMKEKGVKVSILRILSNGNLILAVDPEYEEKMREIHEQLGLQRPTDEEQNEDPVVE